MIKIGGQFSGVGALDQALKRLNIDYHNVYQAEWDKYARITYLANNEKPDYYVENVYDTPIKEITEKYGSLDLFMTSPPCQSFSLAGKRLGKDDPAGRGILFSQSLEFIRVNKPRFFIFENVKGLLSDDNGKTFSEWIHLLGGKSINKHTSLFPNPDSVPYHIYHRVLNAKDYDVPQNRERIFIVGIRDDNENNFTFPKPQPLGKKLKDILEKNVDEKYYLSEKMMQYLYSRKDNYNNGKINIKTEYNIASCINASSGALDISDNILKVKGNTRLKNTLNENKIESLPTFIDAYNNRVNNDFAWTILTNIDSACNTYLADKIEPKIIGYTRNDKGKVVKRHEKDISGTITTSSGSGGNTDEFVKENYRIRKLTERECFRLMDFPDSFDISKVSRSQAYRQAGNSIVVKCLELLIKNISLYSPHLSKRKAWQA